MFLLAVVLFVKLLISSTLSCTVTVYVRVLSLTSSVIKITITGITFSC